MSTDKSYVSMEQAVCPVCGTVHDTGALLLDKRLRATFERHTVTHYAMCAEHQKLKDDGYIALVECSNQPRGLDNALRTGPIAHIRATAWPNLFDVPVPSKGLAFIEVGVIEKLQRKVAQ